MNAQEALEILNRGYAWQYNHPEEWFTAKRLFEQLVYRATPKKPIKDDEHIYDDGICPNCKSSRIGNWEFSNVFYKHCADCGQEIDWSKDELPREEKK